MSSLAQPIHPSVRESLDEEYVKFHDEHLAHVTPSHRLPFARGPIPLGRLPGEREPHPAATSKDVALGESVKARVYTPPGQSPSIGWPALVWYHGGAHLHHASNMALTVAMQADAFLEGLKAKRRSARVSASTQHVLSS